MTEIKAQKHFQKENEVQCRDKVPAKRKEGWDVRLLSLAALPATSLSIFLSPNYPNCYRVHKE